MKRPLQWIIKKCTYTDFIYHGTNLHITYNFKNHSTVDNRYVCYVLVATLEYNEYCNPWSQTALISTNAMIWQLLLSKCLYNNIILFVFLYRYFFV